MGAATTLFQNSSNQSVESFRSDQIRRRTLTTISSTPDSIQSAVFHSLIEKNKDKLNSFSSFNKGWDGYYADRLSLVAIRGALSFLELLDKYVLFFRNYFHIIELWVEPLSDSRVAVNLKNHGNNLVITFGESEFETLSYRENGFGQIQEDDEIVAYPNGLESRLDWLFRKSNS